MGRYLLKIIQSVCIIIFLGVSITLIYGGLAGAGYDYTASLSYSTVLSHPNWNSILSCFPTLQTLLVITCLFITTNALILMQSHWLTITLLVQAVFLMVFGGGIGFGLLLSDIENRQFSAEWLGEAWPMFEFMFVYSIIICSMPFLEIQKWLTKNSSGPAKSAGP